MTDGTARDQMEATLLAIAEADVDIIPSLFDRFFTAFPDQRAAFINLGAATGRMTSETIEAMIGLANGESWVPVTITNFVDLHRNYGEIRFEHYAAFVDMTVDALADAVPQNWTAAQNEAWRTQAERLKAMIAVACNGRTPVLST